VWSFAVGFRINGNGFDAHFFGASHDTKGYFPPISDQDFLDNFCHVAKVRKEKQWHKKTAFWRFIYGLLYLNQIGIDSKFNL
jgi:hypothetical protein